MAAANKNKDNVFGPEEGNVDLVDIFYKTAKKKKKEPFDSNKKLIDSLTGIAERSKIDDVLDTLSTEIL